MNKVVTKSAQRTDENSPAIYRWERSFVLEASPRSGRQNVCATTLRFFCRRFTGSDRKQCGNLPSSELLGYFRSSASRTEPNISMRKLTYRNSSMRQLLTLSLAF